MGGCWRVIHSHITFVAPKPPFTGHWAALRDGSGGDGGGNGRVGDIYTRLR